MDMLLFPNWLLFAGLFLFLKIYNPTRLYLDNSTALAIAVGLAIVIDSSNLGNIPTPFWVLSVIIFAMFSSVPYWLSGMVGSVIQQLLLLNEQSVQDKRFTDESEALSKISSLMFLMYALDSGVVFRPLLAVISENIEQGANVGFDTLYFYITDSLTMMAMVTGKYMVLLLCITICCGYVDLFFKKASLSISTTADIKAITMIIILNLWLLQDQFYVFKQIMKKAGYE